MVASFSWNYRVHRFWITLGVCLGLALIQLASAPSSAMACPFCSMQGQTLTGEVNQASMVLFGTLANAKLNADGFDQGSTDLQIEAVIKKNDILGPISSDFGYHVIRVTDIKPAKVKLLAEARPEIEANLKKQAAGRNFAESAEAFSNMVYEQSTSLKPAAERFNLAVQQSPWIGKGASPVPVPTR